MNIFTAEVHDEPKVTAENKEPLKVEQLAVSSDETTSDSHVTVDPATSESIDQVQEKSDSVKWVIDNNFRKELIRLGISEDPLEWLA